MKLRPQSKLSDVTLGKAIGDSGGGGGVWWDQWRRFLKGKHRCRLLVATLISTAECTGKLVKLIAECQWIVGAVALQMICSDASFCFDASLLRSFSFFFFFSQRKRDSWDGRDVQLVGEGSCNLCESSWIWC